MSFPTSFLRSIYTLYYPLRRRIPSLACFIVSDEPLASSDTGAARVFDDANRMESGSMPVTASVSRPPYCSPHLTSSQAFAHAPSAVFAPHPVVTSAVASPYTPCLSTVSPSYVGPVASHFDFSPSPVCSVTVYPTFSNTAVPTPLTTVDFTRSITATSTPSATAIPTLPIVFRTPTVSPSPVSIAEPATPPRILSFAGRVTSDMSPSPTCDAGDFAVESLSAPARLANTSAFHQRTMSSSSTESVKTTLGRPLSYLTWLWHGSDGSSKWAKQEQSQNFRNSFDAAGDIDGSLSANPNRSQRSGITSTPQTPYTPHTPHFATRTHKRWVFLDCTPTLPSPVLETQPPVRLPSPWSAHELAKKCSKPTLGQSTPCTQTRARLARLTSPWSIYVVLDEDSKGDGGSQSLGISTREQYLANDHPTGGIPLSLRAVI